MGRLTRALQKMHVDKMKENSDQNLDLLLCIGVCWCHLLITFANSLEPDQARQYVWPDLDPNCLILMVFLKEFYKKVDFEKKSANFKKHAKLPSYLGDTRPEFKMWGGASKSVFVLVLKICQHQFASKILSC